MPGPVANAAIAIPPPVLPANLCRAFTEALECPVVLNEYLDGTTHRANRAVTTRRRWRLDYRLAPNELWALREFFEVRRGTEAFYFYNPFEPAAGHAAGSNYDGTGASTQGRYAVVFAGVWAQSTGMPRTNISLELVEVA